MKRKNNFKSLLVLFLSVSILSCNNQSSVSNSDVSQNESSSSEHTSSNYTKQKGEYSSGLHGVGGKVVNALSSIFTVDSYVLGEARHVEFYKGLPWEEGEQVIENKDNKQITGNISKNLPLSSIGRKTKDEHMYGESELGNINQVKIEPYTC